jgi:GNAT superfamily N-acetyltransferase
MNGIVALPAEPEHFAGLGALFEATGSSCYCRFWHFAGDKNAWLDRSAHRPEDSRAELERAFGARSAQAAGVVALDADRVVGWMKLAPVEALDKLYAQRIYRGLPVLSGDRSGVWAVGCFLVETPRRRRGVARALLDAGVAWARTSGARAIEAFPRRATGVPDEQLFAGPLSTFLAAGFVVVHDGTPYPVLRYDLRAEPLGP